jgi:uncharacterized protein (TIGR02268 family)
MEVRIHPTGSTVVLFDAPLTHVEVEAPRRFRRVRVAGDTLVLVPAGKLVEGARVGLTLHFQDGVAPECAVLRADADAERQAEVHRRPGSPGRPSQEEQALREENQRLRQEVERLRETKASPQGLIELLADEPLKQGDFAVRSIGAAQSLSTQGSLRVHTVLAYRAGAQVALVLELENQDAARPWRVGVASLEARGATPRPLEVRAPVPIGPGKRGRIVVGATIHRKEAQGTFTVRLSEAGGGPDLTVGDVAFP